MTKLTESSLIDHGVLTESSLIDHVGKGREGKGREWNRNGEVHLWLACKSNRHLRNARGRDDLDLR